jgi:hypothetical protein
VYTTLHHYKDQPVKTVYGINHFLQIKIIQKPQTQNAEVLAIKAGYVQFPLGFKGLNWTGTSVLLTK